VPFSRTISQALIVALLACGTIAAQTQPSKQQPASNANSGQTATGLAQAPGNKRSGTQTIKKVYVSPSVLSGRSRRRSKPMIGDPPPSYKLPPSPPQISYVDGELTVVAKNSTLSDVLKGIQTAIGAKIEGVMPSDTDRVFGQFGPASPQAVCGTLLTGSTYDFIIMGSPKNPELIERIILTGRSAEPVSTPPAMAAAPHASDVEGDDGQDMTTGNNQAADSNQIPMTPEQQQELPPQVEAPAPSQQATQDQQAAPAPTHPQHWGVNYPRPQQTPSPQPSPSPH